jgi:hypothetical protein
MNDLAHLADELRIDLGDPPEALRIRSRDLELGRKPWRRNRGSVQSVARQCETAPRLKEGSS